MDEMDCVKFCLFFGVYLLVFVDVKGRFFTKPQTLVVVEGDSVDLPCLYKKTDDREYHHIWIHDRSPSSRPLAVNNYTFEPYGKIFVVGDHPNGEYNLQVKNVTSSDSGTYRCQVNWATFKNSYEDYDEMPTRTPDLYHTLIVKVPVHNVTTLEKGVILIRRKSTVVLNCFTMGTNPELFWSKEGGGFPSTFLRHESSSHVVFYLYNVTEAHAGNYTCSARNDVSGNRSVSADPVTIKVLYAPRLIMPIRRFTVHAGETFNITCTCSGFPLPNFTWYRKIGKNYTPLTENIIYIMHRWDNFSSVLTIHNTTDNHSSYLCNATNLYGSSSSYASVHVSKSPVARNTIFSVPRVPHVEVKPYEEQSPTYHRNRVALEAPSNGLSQAGFLAAIVVPIALLLLLFVDTICCFHNDWGVLSCTVGRLLKIKRPPSSRVHSIQCKPTVENTERGNSRLEEETYVIPFEEAQAVDAEDERRSRDKCSS